MLFSFSVLPPTSPEVEEATPLAGVKGKEKEKIREKKLDISTWYPVTFSPLFWHPGVRMVYFLRLQAVKWFRSSF